MVSWFLCALWPFKSFENASPSILVSFCEFENASRTTSWKESFAPTILVVVPLLLGNDCHHHQLIIITTLTLLLLLVLVFVLGKEHLTRQESFKLIGIRD